MGEEFRPRRNMNMPEWGTMERDMMEGAKIHMKEQRDRWRGITVGEREHGDYERWQSDLRKEERWKEFLRTKTEVDGHISDPLRLVDGNLGKLNGEITRLIGFAERAIEPKRIGGGPYTQLVELALEDTNLLVKRQADLHGLATSQLGSGGNRKTPMLIFQVPKRTEDLHSGSQKFTPFTGQAAVSQEKEMEFSKGYASRALTLGKFGLWGRYLKAKNDINYLDLQRRKGGGFDSKFIDEYRRDDESFSKAGVESIKSGRMDLQEMDVLINVADELNERLKSFLVLLRERGKPKSA